jgi:glutamate/tyrosine decarboxylase-like PLP-dependent enzyme
MIGAKLQDIPRRRPASKHKRECSDYKKQVIFHYTYTRWAAMDSLHVIDQSAELDSISVSFQAVFDRLLRTTQDVKNDPLLRVTQKPEIPRLKEISTPGDAHPVQDAIEDVFTISDFRLRTNHPRCFTFIPSPVSPLSWIGDCLSSAFNSFAGSKLQGSGVAIVEQTLLQWLSSKVGLPDTAGGIFVSGGSMANMSGMVLARECILEPGTEDLGVAYLSDQTHHSVAKALRIIGIKRNQVRVVATDSSFQMDVTALRKAIRDDRDAGLKPFVIVGTCGTTNTGSIDPLADLAQVRDDENVWLHIDGAHGASASLGATRSSVTNGLGLADSISWDAHKWLFQTYSCSLILVRNKINLTKVFTNDGDYLRDALEDEDIPNFWNFGMELTRPSRALKLWFTLRVLGVERLGQMIDHGFHLAEIAEAEIQKLPSWEITSRASMAIVTFRYAPKGKTEEERDELNGSISRHFMENNIAGILTTKLRGRVVLRICSISPVLSADEMVEVVMQLD